MATHMAGVSKVIKLNIQAISKLCYTAAHFLYILCIF